ncbi:hypothetical protein BpHYR1_009599 [Brachionus plicatilis]|uniref:Uncharacterized protein n=1 Tax=Brachionus plicatilis TaxID=10195 RepID=A0A3M7T5W7_BRAPC|nr:hypothetical protein BpHYR1_009599 [Brachionus plicatilis]
MPMILRNKKKLGFFSEYDDFPKKGRPSKIAEKREKLLDEDKFSLETQRGLGLWSPTGGLYDPIKFLYKLDSKNRGYESFSISAWILFCARSNVSWLGLRMLWAVCALSSMSKLTSLGEPIATKSW